MDSKELSITTGSSASVVDLTSDCREFVSGKGDGLLSVFAPHATAGLAILEIGAGSDSDLLGHIDELFPRDHRWRHAHGSTGHGADHVIPALIAPSITVPVVNGALVLGTWQSIVLVDPNRDNPHRTIRLSFLPG